CWRAAVIAVLPALLACVATDEGEDLQRLVQGIGEGDLGDGQSLLPGENAGAVEVPEILLVAVGLDTDLVERCVESVQVVAGKAAGEETAGKGGPDRKGVMEGKGVDLGGGR